MRTAALLVVFVLAPAALAAGPGAKMYNEFYELEHIYPDEEWQEYVDAIGRRLLRHGVDTNKEYYFFVLDSPDVNAFATPDAYIFLNRGLIAFLRSEDELAAVIGHEIGHVVGQHAARRNTAQKFGKSLGLISAVVTGIGTLSSLSDAVTAQIVSGYGRDMELEADHYGGEFLAKAGYNPMAIIDVVQVLKDQEVFSTQVEDKPTNYHGLFASHPKNDKRLHDAVAYAQSILPETTMEPVGDFWAMMDGLTYGDEVVQGTVRDNIFYHGGLRVVIEFPKQWTVVDTPTQVRGTHPGGKEVAVISVSRLEPVEDTTPSEYVTDVLQRDDVKTGAEVDINGFLTYVGEIDVSDSVGTKNAEYIAVMYRGADIFLFKGECGPQGPVVDCEDWFGATVQGLRTMRAQDKQTVSGRGIRVLTAEPSQTYAELAARSALREHAEEKLRLLNAHYPNGEPRAGDRVKTVR